MDHIALLEVELSIRELYVGAPLLPEALTAIVAQGFELVALEPGFHDARDGSILQFDGLFARPDGHDRDNAPGVSA